MSCGRRCGTPGCLRLDFHQGLHDGETVDAHISIAIQYLSLSRCQYLESGTVLAAAQQCIDSNPDATCFIDGHHVSSARQYRSVLTTCVPNVDATMANEDAVLAFSVGNMVNAGATIRMVQVPMKPHHMYILQVRLLAVHPDYQTNGYGSRLINQLKDLLSSMPGSLKHMHVQADNGAIGFWSKQGFHTNSSAKALTRALAAWHPRGNELHSGTTSMTAIVS